MSARERSQALFAQAIDKGEEGVRRREDRAFKFRIRDGECPDLALCPDCLGTVLTSCLELHWERCPDPVEAST